MKDISNAMDRVEEFLIKALYSNGSSTLFGIAYAIFYVVKGRINSEANMSSEMEA